ncbi:B9 domain-containing protein 2-like [Bolinopsis microptera]|uniref:B9 domain-containing protein 2-like n=1 Tax=Bolinopsis microptera TaxID=2820187 RepID=UPI00307A7052
MAEVHIIGNLDGGEGFSSPNLSCKWCFETGGAWRLLEGVKDGQTQVDHPIDEGIAHWSHPIDLHYAIKGIQGWPKLSLQVYSEDMYGRTQLVGYGFVHLPTSPGFHKIECPTWQLAGSAMDQVQSYFVGSGPQLINDDVIASGSDRYRLQTIASGTVYLSLFLVTRNFNKFGIES